MMIILDWQEYLFFIAEGKLKWRELLKYEMFNSTSVYYSIEFYSLL